MFTIFSMDQKSTGKFTVFVVYYILSLSQGSLLLLCHFLKTIS
jgi:hypothetical protein